MRIYSGCNIHIFPHSPLRTSRLFDRVSIFRALQFGFKGNFRVLVGVGLEEKPLLKCSFCSPLWPIAHSLPIYPGYCISLCRVLSHSPQGPCSQPFPKNIYTHVHIYTQIYIYIYIYICIYYT